MKKVSVIIPTTGADTLSKCVESVLNQSYETQAYIVVDGYQYKEKVSDIMYQLNVDEKKWVIMSLPENVGGGGFYGHRVYAGVSHFVNSDYVSYLDQDCFLDDNHIESMVNTIEKNDLDWCYSLRKIVNKDGKYICNDDCESLGKWNPVMKYNHVDTNCYCIKTNIAIKISQVWHGGWGQDRVFYSAISQHFPKFDCSGKYTVNYRLDGNDGSVRSEFFEQWNERINELFGGKLPWQK